MVLKEHLVALFNYINGGIYMREVMSLLKVSIKNTVNTSLGEKIKGKIIKALIAIILFNLLLGVYVVVVFNMSVETSNEITIFNFIINLDLILALIIILFSSVNIIYFNSGWREKIIYPIKLGNLLISKIIKSYLIILLCSVSCILMPLIIFGFLIKASLIYYIYIILYKVLIITIPIIFFVLISLTIFWLVKVFKKDNINNKVDIWILIFDLAIILLGYFLINNNGKSNKISELLLNIFFNGDPNNLTPSSFYKFLFIILMIIVSYIGFYLIGGSLYIHIMRSGIFSSSSKGGSFLDYKFKTKGIIISNIIRDLKVLTRTPSLRFNCISFNIVCTLTFTILLLVFSKYIINASEFLTGFKGYLAMFYFLTLVCGNYTGVCSFSREGRALDNFKTYPISRNSLLISKFCVEVLTNIGAFLSTTVLVILMASNFLEFIIVELLIVIYMIGIVIIHIGSDITNINSKWVKIKDIFDIQSIIKLFKPYFIITGIPMIFLYIIVLGFGIEVKSEIISSIFLYIPMFIYSYFSYKKITKYNKEKKLV